MKQLFSRRKTLIGTTPSLPDFSGLNLTRFYATFKSNIALNDLCAIVTKGSFLGTETLTWDVNGDIDFSAIVSDDDTVDWFYRRLYCQITEHQIDGSDIIPPADQWCKAWDGTTQTNTEKNSKPSWKFKQGNTGLTSGFRSSVPISELDSGNDFSIVSVVSNEVSNSNGGVINTTLTATDRCGLFVDRRIDKRHTLIRASSVNYETLYPAQIDTATTRILITTVNGTTGEMKSYLDGVLQDTVTFLNSYVNDILRFGAVHNNGTQLDGHMQMVGVADAIWSQTDVTDITNRLNTQFGL